MSEARELLKRAASVLHDKFDGVKYMEPLIEEIDAYLAKPEPEPVAYMTSDKRMLIFADVIKKNLDTTADGMTPLYSEPPAQNPLSIELLNRFETLIEKYGNLCFEDDDDALFVKRQIMSLLESIIENPVA